MLCFCTSRRSWPTHPPRHSQVITSRTDNVDVHRLLQQRARQAVNAYLHLRQLSSSAAQLGNPCEQQQQMLQWQRMVSCPDSPRITRLSCSRFALPLARPLTTIGSSSSSSSSSSSTLPPSHRHGLLLKLELQQGGRMLCGIGEVSGWAQGVTTYSSMSISAWYLHRGSTTPLQHSFSPLLLNHQSPHLPRAPAPLTPAACTRGRACRCRPCLACTRRAWPLPRPPWLLWRAWCKAWRCLRRWHYWVGGWPGSCSMQWAWIRCCCRLRSGGGFFWDRAVVGVWLRSGMGGRGLGRQGGRWGMGWEERDQEGQHAQHPHALLRCCCPL